MIIGGYANKEGLSGTYADMIDSANTLFLTQCHVVCS